MCRIDSTGLVFLEKIDETGKPALPEWFTWNMICFSIFYKCISCFYETECDVMSEAGIM